MRILFHLGHPAHFHLFKNTISSLKSKGYDCVILIKKKDVLQELLDETDYEYYNILPTGRKDSLFAIGLGLIKQDFNILKFCLKNKVNILVGTSASISHVGILLNIPSLIVGEDDADVVPLLAKTSYPFATAIVTPDVCSNGRWEYKSIKYNGYHELAYLHPEHFTPDKSIAEKYIDGSKPYYIIRFAKLSAHHDSGVKGINDELALKIVLFLKQFGNVYITSERVFSKKLDQYRLSVKANDIHHVMAFSDIFIGDSQTMSAEAGVLGVPFVRYNDFVGKIGYLNDLETKYNLGFGISTTNPELIIKTLENIVKMDNMKEVFIKRQRIMLSEKINVAKYLENLIINYIK